MEPRDRPAKEMNAGAGLAGNAGAEAMETQAVSDSTAARSWIRLAAGCAVLVGLAFVQSPGLQIADTKFDLVADPGAFLARAAHLWDASGAFGQLQNQAYGYLWPMAPFFWLGHVVGLDGWVVQRLWMALVMCTAFVGLARLCRAVGIRSDLAAILAGLAYATSPRLISTIGPISSETWPLSLAPWVLLPLVLGTREGWSARRMALLSALGVAMVGGVNAVATFAVIPLGAVWLLTRAGGPRRRTLLLWWPLFTLLGTLWWLVPLFAMGAYSPPFLHFIESASVTTFPTTLYDALRGTSDWVPYVDPTWQGGHQLITTGFLALNSGLVLMLGMAGLMLHSTRDRLFLALSLVLGLFLVTMGHLGEVQGWAAGSLRPLLDQALAPLRNVHKFDPVVRVPLTLGVGWLVQAAVDATPRPTAGGLLRRWGSPAAVFGAVCSIGVAGAAIPVISGQLVPTNAVLRTPGYWRTAVRWLDGHGPGTSLLAPGSSFGTYLWGSPHDEPVQYLAQRRWAVRNAVPLTPSGNIRMLDAFEARLSRGQPSPGLATFLRRAGVRYVVVRNDLRPDSDVPDPALVHRVLDESPGLGRVRTFGPLVGSGPALVRRGNKVVADGGWQQRHAAIEVYAVGGGGAAAVSGSGTPTVVGGPEDLLSLSDLGVLGTEPTRLGADQDPGRRPAGRVILTDGMQDREHFFGRIHDATSAVLGPGDVRRSGNPVRDYLVPDPPQGNRWRTAARLTGARWLSASSSASDSDALGGSNPGRLPFAAVDGDLSTEWDSGTGTSGRAWWAMGFTGRPRLSRLTVTLGRVTGGAESVRVRTARGIGDAVRLEPGDPTVLSVPAGRSPWLRVESTEPGTVFSLAEVRIPHVEVRRELVLPRIPRGWGAPASIVLRALADVRTGCVESLRGVACVEARAQAPEEPSTSRRLVRLPRGARYRPTLRVRPRLGDGLVEWLQRGRLVHLSASSTAVADPRGSVVAATDGLPGSTWIPRSGDRLPTLRLSWLRRQRLTGIHLEVDKDAPARQPTRVVLEWPGGQRQVDLVGGSASFPAIRTSDLTIGIVDAQNGVSTGTDGQAVVLPVGVGELTLDGTSLTSTPSARVRRLGCGSGPTVLVDGRRFETSVEASEADLYAGRTSLLATVCGTRTLSLHAGDNQVEVRGSDDLQLSSLVLSRSDLRGVAGPVRTASLRRQGPTHMVARPGAGDHLLVLRQNVNPGWEARQGGRRLRSVTVDGWQQAFVTDGSRRPVDAVFAPDRPYRLGLVVGGAALLLLLALVVPGRRWSREAPSLRGFAMGPLSGLAVAPVAGGVLGAWPGAALAVGGAAVWLLLRGATEARVWLFALMPLVGALWYLLQPWASDAGWAGDSVWPSYLVLVGLGGVVASAAGPPRRRRLRRRMTGSSTAR